MKTFYSPTHIQHAPALEFEAGRLVPIPEVPARADSIRIRIEERKLGPILAPGRFGLEPILRVHDRRFVDFLSLARSEWEKRYGEEAPDAIPSAWPVAGMRRDCAGDIETLLGTYGFDTATPITRGTWAATLAAVDTAVSAAHAVHGGERSAFALTRPPGHHAGAALFGGYCYLNNAAIAAHWCTDRGLRIAILDVDYHHGNGTQAIFYDRADVFYCSLHADPAFAFPHFTGFADERGAGMGEGANLNLPLPSGTNWSSYVPALHTALRVIREFGPDILIVSLGLDTFERDPICDFRLKTEDYFRIGEAIATLRVPTLFLLEGGYDVATLGMNTVNALEGYMAV